jgi:hypothetical protein
VTLDTTPSENGDDEVTDEQHERPADPDERQIQVAERSVIICAC